MAQKQIEEMKSHCMTTLEKLGASEEIIKFYSEALECEYDISLTIYRLQSKLKSDVDSTGSLPPNVTFGILQTMTKHFRNWKKRVESLTEQGITVPPLQLDLKNLSKLKMLTAVCSMDTNQMNLKEGEELQITDASHPNWLKVRNVEGKEGFLPALSCLIPTPDNNAITAVERLQVLLLTSWTESIRELRSILASTCVTSAQDLNRKWGSLLLTDGQTVPPKLRDKLTSGLKRISDCSSRSNVNLDLNRLHLYLSKLENNLLNANSANSGLAVILRSIESLDRAVLCYQSLFCQWTSFRRSLNESSRPIRIVEQWEELRRAARFKQFKYYEMKMVLEEVDTAEEIIYINSETGETYTSECRKKRQKVIAEELRATKQEEKKKFIIKGVIDPRSGDRVAFRYAVAEGIVDHANGLYVHPDTGEGIPIQRAMSEGKIVVEYTSVQKGSAETTAVPLITIKKRIDRKYRVTGALDPRTAERVDVGEAMKRGLIDSTTGEFVNEEKGGLRTPEREAVEDGWILAEFDDSSPSYESETYAILAVYDDKIDYFTSFNQAIRRGLIDPESGNYVSPKSGKRIYAADAIARGLIKAKRCPSDITETEVFREAVESFKASRNLEAKSPTSASFLRQQSARLPPRSLLPPPSAPPTSLHLDSASLTRMTNGDLSNSLGRVQLSSQLHADRPNLTNHHLPTDQPPPTNHHQHQQHLLLLNDAEPRAASGGDPTNHQNRAGSHNPINFALS